MDSSQVPSGHDPHLATLWTQLNELNSAINITAEQREGLVDLQHKLEDDARLSGQCVEDLFGDQYRRLRDLVTKLEGLRDSTRLAINERLRPNLRPVKILELPDEILRHIFQYTRGGTTMLALSFDDASGGDVEQVKKLRLTCRRFCENSSHLLMYFVKVAMTPLSIAHLTDVSRNQISKGIRCVKISLGRGYDSGIAHDIQAFAEFRANELRGGIRAWNTNRTLDNPRAEVYECALNRAIPIVEAWEDVAQNGLNKISTWTVVLKRAQQQYRQCYESQKLLKRDAFPHPIASAIKRMPTATWLRFESSNSVQGDRNLKFFCPEDFDNPDFLQLQLKLQDPEYMWRGPRFDGVKSPGLDTIPGVLLSIGRAGTHLTGLEICVTLPDDWSSFSTTEVDYSKLRAATQQLRAFAFSPPPHRREESSGETLLVETPNVLSGFLSTILDTSHLQKIELNFDFMYNNIRPDQQDEPDEPLQPTDSMAPLLLSRSWPNLRLLIFNGPFFFEELQKVVNGFSKQVRLKWGGYLMDASWAEVLDFLRDRVSAGTCLGSIDGMIAGAEWVDMTGKEEYFIFYEDDAGLGLGSKANQFICGSMMSNPIKDWERGFGDTRIRL